MAVQSLVPLLFGVSAWCYTVFLGFGGGLVDLPAFYYSLTLDLGLQEG